MTALMRDARQAFERCAARYARRAMTVAIALGTVHASAEAQSSNVVRLKELSLEELASLEVRSVSRYDEPLADAAAAVFVITADDIRRSGATSLAEIIRLAPNAQVARMDAAQYAISARGFNNAIANKLLVLVDGRTIYTPLFSGVFWDQQEVFLEDIERVEIISGPGATLWGANAVNGVINITTYAAGDTRGALATFAGGNREQHASVRFGTSAGNGHVRVYGKALNLESTRTSAGGAALDARRSMLGGFRADWGDDAAGLTLQGRAYDSRSEDRGSVAGFELGRVGLSGASFLGRVTRQLDANSDFRFQAYVDHYKRNEKVLFQPEADLLDLELQYGRRAGRHRFISGGGYRYGRDDVEDGILIGFRPTGRALHWENAFIHDDVQLSERLQLSGGIKLERNDYTGWEQLPSSRIAWKAAGDQLVWGGWSRAVRAPARLDREIIAPLGPVVLGGPSFESEVANVFEIGYRGQLGSAVRSSVTTFLHRWDKLRSGTAPPVFIENRIEGPVYGVEAWATWQATGFWRVSGGFTALGKDLRLEEGSTDPIGTANPQLANDPGHQWMMRSSLNIARSYELDVLLRRVGRLPHPSVPAYTAADLRLAKPLQRGIELSLQAQNLFDRSHPEFGAEPGRSEFRRGVLAKIVWSPDR
jgi:iron complex outermembrane receptor protein